MEPLPEERSDHRLGLQAAEEGGGASMEPLPEERSDHRGALAAP